MCIVLANLDFCVMLLYLLTIGRSDSSQRHGSELYPSAAHTHHTDQSWAGQSRTPPTTPHWHTAVGGDLWRETGGGLSWVVRSDLSPPADIGRYLYC